MNMNRVFFGGNLTRDPEMKFTPSGVAVCEFGIACSRKSADKETTIFMDCKAFQRTAEIIAEHFSKGRPILIEGRLDQRSWEDREGNRKSKVEIVVDQFQFCGGDKPAGGGQRAGQRPPPASQASRPRQSPESYADSMDLDDDNPF